jgi:hypothetical protein
VRRRLLSLLLGLALPACAAAPSGDDPSIAGTASPSTASAWPSAMSNPGATWDPASGMTLLFSAEGELWGWDGTAWTLLDDGRGTAPSPRDDAQMVADPVRGVVWLHGGRSGSGSGMVAHTDTWRWDGEAWTEIVPDGSTAAPPPRVHPVSAWDPVSERMVLLGGIALDDAVVTDAWAWDGTSWRELPNTWPPGRVAAIEMAHDPATGELVVLAVDLAGPDDDGLYPSQLLRRTDAGAWERLAEGPAFSPIQPMVATHDGLLLVDGGTQQGASATWTWDGAAWAQATVDGPTPRNGQALVHDAARDRVVLFGGWGGGYLDDLWEWDGSTWAERG